MFAITKKGTVHNIVCEKREPLSGNTVVLVDSPYDEDSDVYDRTYYGDGTWWMYPSEIREIVDESCLQKGSILLNDIEQYAKLKARFEGVDEHSIIEVMKERYKDELYF